MGGLTGRVPTSEDFCLPGTLTQEGADFQGSEGHTQGPTACWAQVRLGTQADAFLCSFRQDPPARPRHEKPSPARAGHPAPEKLFSPRQHGLPMHDLLTSVRSRVKAPQLTLAQAALGRASIAWTPCTLASKVGSSAWGLSAPHTVCLAQSTEGAGHLQDGGGQTVPKMSPLGAEQVLHRGMTRVDLMPHLLPDRLQIRGLGGMNEPEKTPN